MLVCFIVPGQRRRQIAAEIVEVAGAAVDLVSDAGFELLLDAPAIASDTCNAFLGELLHEAASAASTQNAGLFYAVLIDEPASAVDSVAGTGGVVDILEPATANTTQDATLVLGIVPRSAMIASMGPIFVNPGVSREANVDGVMVNQ